MTLLPARLFHRRTASASSLQVSVEEGEHGLVRTLCVVAAEAMSPALDRQQLRFHVRRLQAVHQPSRLLVCHVVVLSAMNAEGRSGIGRDPVERTRPNVPCMLLFEV